MVLISRVDRGPFHQIGWSELGRCYRVHGRDMQWPFALRLLPEEEMSWEPQWSAYGGWDILLQRGSIQASDGDAVSGQRLWIQVGSKGGQDTTKNAK